MARPFSKNKSWLRKFSWHRNTSARSFLDFDHRLYPPASFREKLVQERRRAERSNRPLLVMIVDTETACSADKGEDITASVGQTLNTCVRGTDICGVLGEGSSIAVILTEIDADKVDAAKRSVARKAVERLSLALSDELAGRIGISFHIYQGDDSEMFDMTFYPELGMPGGTKIGADIVKRSVDVVGSMAGILLFSPFFAILPILIKLNSKGPVFFRQERIGRNGRKFKVLKFRSMYLDNDDVIHREYVKKLIKGNVAATAEGNEAIFKLKGDPRVTPVGRYLRKYSLDELPQFFNVFVGDMSLVGPRPPIRYEVEHYSGWQRNRLMGKKPGITGLWQVTGRSSTSFDDMVRLDLRYLNNWNIMLDFKILLKTPLAVLKCKGAY